MGNLKKVSWKDVAVFILLAGAGACLNMMSLSFELGQTFFLGGIAVLLIFMTLPFPFALISVLLINLPFLGSWRFFFFPLFALAELFFLWFARRKGIRNLVGVDGIFWLFPGLPLIFVLTSRVYGFEPGLSFAFFAGIAVNGIICVTSASMLYYGWILWKARILNRPNGVVFSLRTILFNTVALGILVISLLFYALDNGRFTHRFMNETGSILEREADRIISLGNEGGSASFMDFTPRPAAFLEEGGAVLRNGPGENGPLGKNDLLWESVESGKSLFLTYGEREHDLLPWMGAHVVFRKDIIGARQGYLFLSYPLAYSETPVEIHYIRTMAVFLVILYGAFLLALILSPLLAGPITELTRIAEALSREETEGLGKIRWPDSTVEEIHNLVDFSQKSYGNMIERNVQLTSLNRSLEYSAYYDGLTKLPNRNLFIDKLDEMIHDGMRFVLVFLDLDGFKMINDTYGHRIGDVILIEYAFRLSNLGKCDFAARLGGDEFALLIPDVETEEQIEERMKGMMERLTRPIDVEGELHSIHSSIGVALSPEHGMSVSALLRNADLAMYKVKSEGKNNWLIYSEELNNTLTQYEMEIGIYKAFEQNQFELYYQPQVDIRTGSIVSLEALIRWNHPEKGFISPSLFIPLAERMDIMIPIGYWVIEEAARKGKELIDRGFRGVISVNVSPRQFSETNFFHATREILERIGLEPCYFGIEVTETMVMGNVSFTSRIISQFMKYGVRVSIDDFGTGYTSLSLLQDLNVHTLKIDQTFVGKVGQSKKNEIVLNNIIKLTKELEMDIVVEGVETEEQNSFFRDRACYTSQGFLYHKPLPYGELKEVLKQSSEFLG